MSIEKAVQEQVSKVVETTVRAAIAESLSKNPADLVEKIVNIAMAEKQNSYDRTTIFRHAVNEMIRNAAKEEFKFWLEDNRVLIRQAIQKRMKDQGGKFVETVAKKLVDGMASNFYATVRLKVEDE